MSCRPLFVTPRAVLPVADPRPGVAADRATAAGLEYIRFRGLEAEITSHD
ncbi:MAG: hypothetical protein LUQ31_06715 [Methanoregula sp.]|nr:hypothetical protein [Methanoregula sp.]